MSQSQRSSLFAVCGLVLVGSALFSTFVAGALPAQEPAHTNHANEPAATADTVPLLTNLGDHHYPISSNVPRVQEYFDQGLRLYYAFNHAEAVRAFEQATRLDPECAICYWAIALAYGPNINAPMDSASGVAAYQAIRRAQELQDGAGPVERGLIAALATRYAEVPPTN